ncbi:hypothetical protein GOODEAATRI_021955 [Goodea atripinnis]|uniref:Uncharacterized protein n=1 Tax=Goodea atripinnis TaxID=208336 RepID=A0ABV0PFY2_9TELE
MGTSSADGPRGGLVALHPYCSTRERTDVRLGPPVEQNQLRTAYSQIARLDQDQKPLQKEHSSILASRSKTWSLNNQSRDSEEVRAGWDSYPKGEGNQPVESELVDEGWGSMELAGNKVLGNICHPMVLMGESGAKARRKSLEAQTGNKDTTTWIDHQAKIGGPAAP